MANIWVSVIVLITERGPGMLDNDCVIHNDLIEAIQMSRFLNVASQNSSVRFNSRISQVNVSRWGASRLLRLTYVLVRSYVLGQSI